MAVFKVYKGSTRISVHQFHRIGSIVVACSVQGKSFDRSSVPIGRVKIELSNRNLVIAYSRVGGSSSSRCIKRKAVACKRDGFRSWVIGCGSSAALNLKVSGECGCCSCIWIILRTTYTPNRISSGTTKCKCGAKSAIRIPVTRTI